MDDMAARAPGQFDAQAPGVTAASGSASRSLEDDLTSLEQQLADLQVRRCQIWMCSRPPRNTCRALFKLSQQWAEYLMQYKQAAIAVLLCSSKCNESEPKPIQLRLTADRSTGLSSAHYTPQAGALDWYMNQASAPESTLLHMLIDQSLQVDREIRIGGWVKTGREAGAGSFAFLEVIDGSCLTNLQARQAAICRCCQCNPTCRSYLLTASAPAECS